MELKKRIFGKVAAVNIVGALLLVGTSISETTSTTILQENTEFMVETNTTNNNETRYIKEKSHNNEINNSGTTLKETVKTTKEIPFQKKIVESSELYVGETKLQQTGTVGKATIYHDDDNTTVMIVETEPKPEITLVGTKVKQEQQKPAEPVSTVNKIPEKKQNASTAKKKTTSVASKKNVSNQSKKTVSNNVSSSNNRSTVSRGRDVRILLNDTVGNAVSSDLSPALRCEVSTGDSGLKPWVKKVRTFLREKYSLRDSSILGTRPGDPQDHGKGLALDIMIRGEKGWEIADYLTANIHDLNIKYIIWEQQIYATYRPRWKMMENRGNDTANHYDHIHISFNNGSGKCPN